MYHISNYGFADPNYMEHYGVKGMKWGKHRMVNVKRSGDGIYDPSSRSDDAWNNAVSRGSENGAHNRSRGYQRGVNRDYSNPIDVRRTTTANNTHYSVIGLTNNVIRGTNRDDVDMAKDFLTEAGYDAGGKKRYSKAKGSNGSLIRDPKRTRRDEYTRRRRQQADEHKRYLRKRR